MQSALFKGTKERFAGAIYVVFYNRRTFGKPGSYGWMPYRTNECFVFGKKRLATFYPWEVKFEEGPRNIRKSIVLKLKQAE